VRKSTTSADISLFGCRDRIYGAEVVGPAATLAPEWYPGPWLRGRGIRSASPRALDGGPGGERSEQGPLAVGIDNRSVAAQ
jgi:hypothetical protein